MKGIINFVKNKNTVTILAILAGILVLWYFYNYRVDQAITTINIPYAIQGIDSGKVITLENIGTKSITKSTLKDSDIITDKTQLDGKYVCTGTSIPANGFLYASQVCDKQELPNSVFDNIKEGYTVYSLGVNNQTTYANSIMPGNYIDLYIQATNEDRQVVYGKLIESIEVLAVRDSSGRDVFWDTSAGDSAYLLFAVPDNYHKLLNIAGLVSGYSIKVFPVPRNASYSENPGETKISSVDLCNFIVRNYANYSDVGEISCND